jgi:hypothetical protein
MTEETEFISWQEPEMLTLRSIHSSYEAHPAVFSVALVSRISFFGNKTAGRGSNSSSSSTLTPDKWNFRITLFQKKKELKT